MWKFPKTPRLEKVLTHDIQREWRNKIAVVTEKMDGAQAGISFDDTGKMILQSRGHVLVGSPREKQFDAFKRWAHNNQSMLYDILGSRYAMFGEWLYAKHVKFYDILPHYFMTFDILDKEFGEFLSTSRRISVIGVSTQIVSAEILETGYFRKFNNFGKFIQKSKFKSSDWKEKLQDLASQHNVKNIWGQTDESDLMEGVYVRIEDENKVIGRMKVVRPGFAKIRDDEGTYWLHRPIIPNQLRENNLWR
jgi:hypothetical protein